MKKAFNFRSALVIVLVLVMCLMAFVACDKDKDGQKDNDNGLSNAKEYVKALYINNSSKTAADYTVVSYVTIAGVKYTVNWSVEITTEGVDASAVKVVAGEESTTIDVIDIAEQDINYTLTATVHDANGNTESVSFKRMVPKFRVNTWAEYVAAKDDELIIADGVVTMYSSKTGGIFTQYGSTTNKGKYNTMYIQNADGAFYAYSMQKDPATIEGLAVGKTVRISGIKKNYQGTLELTEVAVKEILDDTIKTVEPVDITTLYTNAEDAKDTTITNLQGQLVTLKNVVILSGDTGTKYCYFTLNGVKSYVRPSTSTSAFPGDKINDFCEAFNTNKGHYATITGQVLTYNSAFYIQPLNENAVVFGEMATLTPAEEVQFVKENADALPDVTNNGAKLTLPTQSDLFEGRVKISWTADNTEICNIENGVATFTYDDTKEGGKVKLTATYTHTDTSVEAVTDVFEVKLLAPKAITVADFLKQSTGNAVYILTGHVVAVNKVGKAGSFVLADETGAVFSYESGNVTLGEKVKVFARRAANNGTPQLYPISIQKVEGSEAYTYPEPETIDVETIKSTTFNASNIADYTGKYTKITGATLYKLGDYINAGLKEGTDYVKYVETYLNDTIKAAVADLIDTPVNIYGYVRGYGNSGKTLQVQVVSIEAKPLNDEEKVAKVKTELRDLTTKENFDLPTSKIATITWALKSGTGATLEGNHVTITQTDADQTVVFTATIVSGEASDTKDITVTIKAKDNRVAGVKGVVGTAYKIVMNQSNLNKTLYLNGEMDGFYFGTTENVDEAADVYLEVVSETDGTYRLYIQKGTTKKYIEIITSGTHINVVFNDSASANPWKWNDTLKTYQTYVKGSDAGKKDGNYALGTFGTNKTFSAQIEDSDNSFYGKLFGTPDPVPVKTNQELVDEAAEALRKDFTITAKSSGATIDLAAAGINNATIVWTSDNAVIAIGALTDGKYVATVNDPTTDGMTVTLTAVLTVGEGDEAKTANCTFPITVTRTLANVEVSLGEITGGTVDVFVGENKQTLPVTLKQEQVITLTPVATDGYELVKVFVNGTELAKGTDGASYTYTLGTTNVQITATFRMITFVTVSVEETIANGSVTVNVGKDALDTSKQYRDGTVLTITATANAGYKLVAVKVNGEKLTGNTYTIKETDTAVEITVEINEIQAMTIAEFKASVDNTEAKVTGIVTNIDSKATWIQDTEGNALYVYATKLAGVEVGKKVTLTGIKGVYKGLLQLKTPVVVKVEDTTDTIAPVVLDEATYKALTANDAAKLVNVNGLVYVSGTANTDNGGTLSFKLGETTVSVRVEKGDAAALNSAVLSKLKSGDKVNLTNVNIGWFNSAQIALSAETQVEVVWDLEAVSDKTQLVVNGTATITATITPAYMAEKVGAITFSTSDDKVLTIDNTNGTVTAVGVGEDAYIIVSAGGKTVNVPIKVVATASAYTVTYSVDGGNGSITSVMAGETAIESGKTTVGADTKITVTVAPAEGYRLASYTIGEGEANTSVAGQNTFELTITANTIFTVAFEVKTPEVKTITIDFSAGYNDIVTTADANNAKDVVIDGVTYTYLNSQQNTGYLFMKKSTGYFANKTAINGTIKKIEVITTNGGSNSAVYYAEILTEAKLESQKTGKSQTGNGTLTVESTTGGSFFNVTQASSKNGQIAKIIITYEEA